MRSFAASFTWKAITQLFVDEPELLPELSVNLPNDAAIDWLKARTSLENDDVQEALSFLEAIARQITIEIDNDLSQIASQIKVAPEATRAYFKPSHAKQMIEDYEGGTALDLDPIIRITGIYYIIRNGESLNPEFDALEFILATEMEDAANESAAAE